MTGAHLYAHGSLASMMISPTRKTLNQDKRGSVLVEQGGQPIAMPMMKRRGTVLQRALNRIQNSTQVVTDHSDQGKFFTNFDLQGTLNAYIGDLPNQDAVSSINN